MSHKARVMVVEDNRLACVGLAALLDAQPDFLHSRLQIAAHAYQAGRSQAASA